MAQEQNLSQTPVQRLDQYNDIFYPALGIPAGLGEKNRLSPSPLLHPMMHQIGWNPVASAVDALRGPQTAAKGGLFGVPPEHLQQMAGEVVYPQFFGFMPGTDPTWQNRSQYYNAMRPAGTQAIQGTPPPNVIPITPPQPKLGD